MTSEPLNQYTDICEGDDERKWAAVFHGFFQGTHGERIHRKINFRQVSLVLYIPFLKPFFHVFHAMRQGSIGYCRQAH